MSSTLDMRKLMKTNTIIEDYEDSYKLFLSETFENSPNYKLVTKNTDSIEYKVFILDYDTDKNLVGYKKFVQYPYDTQVFYAGDYIVWNNENWLIFAIDNQFNYNIRGKIKKCNNTFKWRDSNNNLLSYPCVVDDKINNSDLDQNKHLIVPEGGMIVYIQQNSYTSEIGINKRFILSGQAFKVNSKINYSSSTFMTLIAQIDNIDENDDLTNNIANNTYYNYSLNINQNNFTQNVSYTGTLTYTLELNNEVVDNTIEWISSDTSKVTIDQSGNIELLSVGTATITCRMLDNRNINDSIIITVSSSLPSTSQTIINPDEYTILQGNSQTYTIYRYVDNVQQADTFTITTTGIPVTNYSISTTNNSFTITNDESYSIGELVVSCKNNNTLEITTYNIKLKGFW